MSPRVLLSLLALLAGPAAGADALRFDPFASPALLSAPAPAPAPAADPRVPWTAELRAVLFAGRRSLANVGGTIVAVGEEVAGYRLVRVQERAAEFEKGGIRHVLELDR